jgi:thioredoxin 1
MTTQGWIAVAVIGCVAGGLAAMQVVMRRRARGMAGTPLPALAGPAGERLSRATHGLVYFWSPTCGACRAITPRVRALAAANPDVLAVDVTQDPGLARALGVMATPTFVEVAGGTLVAHHVGPVRDEVLARYRS